MWDESSRATSSASALAWASQTPLWQIHLSSDLTQIDSQAEVLCRVPEQIFHLSNHSSLASDTLSIPLINSPASSRTSAVKYSKIALAYTAAFAPIRTWFWVRDFRKRWIRPTGNWWRREKIEKTELVHHDSGHTIESALTEKVEGMMRWEVRNWPPGSPAIPPLLLVSSNSKTQSSRLSKAEHG